MFSAESDVLCPLTRGAKARPCECCAQRGLHIYRADCLRCLARDMARGIPRHERERREQMAKKYDAEHMATLRRMVGEERQADLASRAQRTEGHA